MLKLKYYSFIVFVSFASFLNAQTNKQLQKEVHERCISISANLDSFTKKTIILPEGTEASIYSDNNEIQLLTIDWIGQTDKKIQKFYFNKSKLFFVYEKETIFEKPIRCTDKDADEEYDIKNINNDLITEDEYFFKNKELLLWLHNKNRQDLSVGTNTLVGKGLIAYLYKIFDNFK
jgi:hypothetical protein